MSAVPEQEKKGITPFSDELERVRGIVGPEPEGLPAPYGEADLDAALNDIVSDDAFASFSEQFRQSELRYRRGALERQALLNHPSTAANVDRAELITVNQAVTYHEYLPMVAREVTEVMGRYEALRATVDDVPADIIRGETMAAPYLDALDAALRERVAYANVLLAEGRLAEKAGNPQDLKRRLEEYRNSPHLNEESKRALAGSAEGKWRRGNALNQRIINILAGAEPIEGVEEQFLPQELYLRLLMHRYEQLLKLQEQAARDPQLTAARGRWEALVRKNTAAREGKGEPLTEEEAREYATLRQRMQDQDLYTDSLESSRKEIIRMSVEFADALGHHQMRKLELTDIQHQFGDRFAFEGVRPPPAESTPANVAKAMAEHMETRRQFHGERLQGFVRVLEEDVLTVGAVEITEDVWNKEGREVLRRFSNAMASLYTLPIPETLGLRARVRDSLTGPLQEALGWPAGKEKWEELTSEEQRVVREKAKSVADAVLNFNTVKLRAFGESVSVVRSLPLSAEYAGTQPQLPLPPERITMANRDALIAQYGGATAHLMALRQMQEDWGSAEPPAGLMGEYKDFLTEVNTTIDVHLDVGEALFRQQEAWENMMWAYLAAAIALLGAGVVLGALGVKVLRMAVRGTARTLWRGGRLTLRGASSVTRATGRQLRNLSQAVRNKPGPAAGHAMFLAVEILTAAEIIRRYNIQLHMERLPEQEAVDAALELMTQHPSVNREAERYAQEVQSLVQRHELMDMWRVVDRTMEALPRDPAHAALKEEGEKLRDDMKVENSYLYDFFPITEYIRRSTVDPQGVLRVFYHNLNEARQKGMQARRDPRGNLKDLLGGRVAAESQPPQGEQVPDEAAKAALLQFNGDMEILERNTKEQGAFLPYKRRFEELQGQYEGWLRKVAAQE